MLYNITYSAEIWGTEVNPELPTEVNLEPFQENDTGTLDNNAEPQLDFIRNEVHKTLISEREECDLQNWESAVIAEEDKGDFLIDSAITESTPTRSIVR